jgi:hypothetical protein
LDSRTSSFYRLEVGNHLPTSPARYGLKKGPISPPKDQNPIKLLNKSSKIFIIKLNNPHLELFRVKPFLCGILVTWRTPCGLRLSPGTLAPNYFAPSHMCLAHVASDYSFMHLKLLKSLVAFPSWWASPTDRAPTLNSALNDRLRVIWKRVSKPGVVLPHISANTTYNGQGHIVWFHGETLG